MEFVSFHEFFPELAQRETHCLTISKKVNHAPPLGDYYFFEMFCVDPDCDCRNALIAIYKEGRDGEFHEVSMVRFCWENGAFYEALGLGFPEERLPGVFIDYNRCGTSFDEFFSAQVGKLCYQDNHETDYARRIKKHYSLFKSNIAHKKELQKGLGIGRNDDCPCGSGKKYKKCCAPFGK